MQVEECSNICARTDINCFFPYKEVKLSNIVSSSGVVSFTGQDFDLALNSPSNITKWGSKLVILINSFFKLLIKESNAIDVWLRDLYKIIS